MNKKTFQQFLKDNFKYKSKPGDIKRFPSQIKEGIKIAAEHGLNTPIGKRKMKSLGFKIKKSTGIAFIGDTHVLKLMFRCSTLRKLKSYEVQTTVLKKYAHNINLVLQPRVEIPALKDRHRIVKFFANMSADENDIHYGNVGIYKNKPTIFDW